MEGELRESRVFFVVSSYVGDRHGQMHPVVPSRGPCRDDRECQLVVKDRRFRKTGPGFPITVLNCKTHGRCFTLYPPGHVPYGRTPLVALSVQGGVVERERGPPYQGTYFQAALDASQKAAWPKEGTTGNAQPRFVTQLRHLKRCCLLFGLMAASRIRTETLWATMGIPGMAWQQARRRVVSHKGFRGKGNAIRQLLNLLPETLDSFLRLATLGHHAGFWPVPQVVEGFFVG